MKGVVWSAESIEKRAAANTGKKRTAEARNNMRLAQLKINKNPEIIEMRRAIANKQWLDPAAREAARQRAIKQMSNQDMRERIRLSNLGRKDSDETKRKKSEAQILVQKDILSRQKQRDSHKGEKSYLWKGGITPLALEIRHSCLMRKWKNDIFARDNYMCTKCSKTRTYLNAHHIFPFSKLIQKYDIKTIEQAEACEELWDISNGITLCLECHKQTY